MSVELNLEGDFDAILDTGEALTLQPRDGSEPIAIAGARRFSTRTTPVADAGGYAAVHDAVWQFSWDGADEPPRVGDELVDVADRTWTILEVEHLAGDTRWRCRARRLEILSGLDSLVDVEAAVWDGSEIIDWDTLAANVPARIQPLTTTIDHDTDPPTSETTYRVTFGAQLALDHNHRLVGPDDTIYHVLEFTQAERIDALPVAVVTRADGE